MNKKIFGFVLAMCLVVGLGSSSFARVEFKAGAGLDSDGDGVVLTIDYETDMKKFAESKMGDLVTFFGYAAGSMTYVANKTSVSFYDANGLKVSYGVAENASYNKEMETYNKEKKEGKNPEKPQKYTYTLQSLNLSANDYAKIKEKYGHLSAEDALKEYLIKDLGVNEKALKVNETDKKGNIVYEKDSSGNDTDKPKMIYAAWFKNAATWLDGGINCSITINLGGSEPTVTLSENGKASATYGSFKGESYIATAYEYNDSGFLVQTRNAELVETSASDDKAQYKLQYSITVMNEYGQQAYTYKVDEKGNALAYTKKKMKVDEDTGNVRYEDTKEKSDPGAHTVDYHYSANGSLESVTDNTTGNTTYYVGGKPAYVTNAENSVISKYNYENGILKSVQAFNNGTVVNTTVFDPFGRELGTVRGEVGYDRAVEEIEKIRDSGAVDDTSIVQSYKVYNDMIAGMSDAARKKHFGKANYTEADSTTYGYTSAIKDVTVTTGKTDNNVEQRMDGDHYWMKKNGQWVSVSVDEYEKAKKNGKTECKVGDDGNVTDGDLMKITVKSVDDIACMSEDDAKKLCKVAGISYSSSGHKKLGDISGGSSKLKESDNKDLVTFDVGTNRDTAENKKKMEVARKIFKAFGLSVPDNVKGDQFKAGDKTLSGGHYLGAKYKINDNRAATLSVTSMSQGVRTQQKTVNAYKVNKDGTPSTTDDDRTKTLVSYSWTSDPAVVGKVDRIETIDGKQYVVLKDAKVDLEDGEGFRSADGEEVYVDISSLSDEQKANLKEGSTFAAAGYIDTSVEGHMAINNLYASEVSGSGVDNMVQSFSASLAGNATYQENVKLNMITFSKAAADGKTYNDVKGGWKLLIEYGGGAPAIF